MLKGLDEILEVSGKLIHEVDYLILGTTIGTNAIVEGNGAKVGLITTKGFEEGGGNLSGISGIRENMHNSYERISGSCD